MIKLQLVHLESLIDFTFFLHSKSSFKSIISPKRHYYNFTLFLQIILCTIVLLYNIFNRWTFWKVNQSIFSSEQSSKSKWYLLNIFWHLIHYKKSSWAWNHSKIMDDVLTFCLHTKKRKQFMTLATYSLSLLLNTVQ